MKQSTPPHQQESVWIRFQRYLTIFQEWFVDHVNFNDKQTSTFDQIPPNLKKLLGRMDTKEYTLLLENTLENLGVDVEAMQSNYLFLCKEVHFQWGETNCIAYKWQLCLASLTLMSETAATS